ncbi:FemAB family PEP-CTERM system-associated protein [Candidatus Roizmanbacteria bacterium]|nr:FemAB family PEP-CTERM system-associated protein [Candidatus Roizmanbacteria bacterium]
MVSTETDLGLLYTKPDVRLCSADDSRAWDDYVVSHPHGSVYHLFAWKRIIESAYGHKAYYLIARKYDKNAGKDKITGILPLFYLKNFIFGKSLVSLPYIDYAGILSNDRASSAELLSRAIETAQELGVDNFEMRHPASIPMIEIDSLGSINCRYSVNTHKVRMLLPLPESASTLMESFKSKLRSQIGKPKKIGLHSSIGGIELLDDFYEVMLVNMRDLGSPIHSKNFFRNILRELKDYARLCIVYKNNTRLAGGLTFGFKEKLSNPWASSLRKHQSLCPNMLLYWSMLEFACSSGCTVFDFGRSSPGEGSYKFKEQWGAVPEQLCWHSVGFNESLPRSSAADKEKFGLAVTFWKRLPVFSTRFLGPMIRKHISL